MREIVRHFFANDKPVGAICHAAQVLIAAGVVRDRHEQGSLLVRERRVSVADELADLAPLPAERQADVVRPRPPLGPGDVAVLEHERRAGRADSLHRRLHDRLERLLEVERLRDRLGDLRQRLELRHAALRLRVELGVPERHGGLVRQECLQRPHARRVELAPPLDELLMLLVLGVLLFALEGAAASAGGGDETHGARFAAAIKTIIAARIMTPARRE